MLNDVASIFVMRRHKRWAVAIPQAECCCCRRKLAIAAAIKIDDPDTIALPQVIQFVDGRI